MKINEKEVKKKSGILTLDEQLKDLNKSISECGPNFKKRIKIFKNKFNETYPLKDNPKKRGAIESFIWALMDNPLLLYGLNINGLIIVELFGILERFTAREVINNIKFPFRSPNFEKIINFHNLSDYALILLDLGVLNKDDIKFIEKLSKLRNGVAHKNPKPIANLLNSGKIFSFLDIDSQMEKIDPLLYIFQTIDILYKLFSFNLKNKNSSY